MSQISSITLPNGTTYEIADITARSMATGGLTLLGITTTALSDGATTATIVVNGKNVSAINGGVAIYNQGEYVFSTTDNKWHKFGDTSGLGSLATKNSASGSYKPEGSVSQPTFSGTAATLSVKGTPSGTVAPASSGTATYTPEGTVSAPAFTGTQGSVSVKGTPSGTVAPASSGTATYTPEGTVSQPTTTVTLNTASKYVAGSATGGGSVTAGTAASCTLPNLEIGVEGETLTLNWTAGSFTANRPTAVTLPSFTSQTIATGVKSATTSQPTFTGTGKRLVLSGAEMTSTGNFTPAGSVAAPTFTGTGKRLVLTGSEMTSTGSYTPAGTVSQPSFTGTSKAVTVS